MIKERLNVVESPDGVLCGYLHNLPALIVQANSIEDVKEKAKDLMYVYIGDLLQILEQDEPFEIVIKKESELKSYDAERLD